MAEKGFKRKLTAILNADAKRYSRLVYDSEEPIPHNLTTYSASIINLSNNTASTNFVGELDLMNCSVENTL